MTACPDFTLPGDDLMRERMKARPQLESLESMTLLSGAAATALSHQGFTEVSTAQAATLTLRGTEHGVFHANRGDSEKSYEIKAAGKLSPFGPTTATGNLTELLVFTFDLPYYGSLQLVTKTGTLTIDFPDGEEIPSGLPTAKSKNEIVATYDITQGTGAYTDDTGSGVVELTFNRAISARSPVQVGRVGITFTSLRPSPTTAAS
jgi:hypothetical protein